jgi:uncharacterized membrane protein YoaK (UPF0700 family)
MNEPVKPSKVEPPRRKTWNNMDGATLRWYEYCAIVAMATALALVAGVINTVSLLSALGSPVSHMTGILTQAGKANAGGAWMLAAKHLGAFTSFVLGAAVTGIICNDRNWSIGPRFGIVLLVEAAVLFAGWQLYYTEHMPYVLFINCFACGLQNALGTMYGSAIVRTTHMTGAATDIGLGLGHVLRARKPAAAVGEAWKLRFFLPLVLMFVAGTTSGTVLFSWYDYHAIVIPATFVGVLGAVYLVVFKALSYEPMSPLEPSPPGSPVSFEGRV